MTSSARQPSFGCMGKAGEFVRDTTYLDGRITADGRDGWPVEPGRYRLVVARACPWAARTLIVRRLLGLEPVLSLGICGPEHDWRSWSFDLDPGGLDPVLGIHWLREAFEKAVPGVGQLLSDPDVSALVIATPHPQYRGLETGKPVADIWNVLGSGVRV